MVFGLLILTLDWIGTGADTQFSQINERIKQYTQIQFGNSPTQI